MVIGVLKVSIAIRHARSLKEKRQVINSLKDRLNNQYNVSIAEVDNQDACQIADLGIVQAGSDARYTRGSLDTVVDVVREFRPAQLTNYSLDIFHQ
ncbi:MAG: DUF503 domain-containing protein [Planctomycetota bacterium]